MDKITIEGIELTEAMLNELKRWYESKNETVPQQYVEYIDYSKDMFIRLMCDDANAPVRPAITEALSQLLILQDSLRKLIPARKCQN
jgi:hypothetical protein